MTRRDSDRPRPALVLAGGLASFGALLGVWIALAGQPDEQDLVAGSCSAAACVALGYLFSQQGRALPSFKRGDLVLLARLPQQVIVESAQVFAVAARVLAARVHRPHLGPPGALGSWSTVPTDPPDPEGSEARGWRAARRDSVLTALVSASPNTIVVEIDANAGTALVHTLVGSSGSRGSGS